ncbi:MAG TPA: MDR family MFS transporter [Corynebacterium sp.]|nr:MDR family MFS transporter [Corynebacterium sp.]
MTETSPSPRKGHDPEPVYQNPVERNILLFVLMVGAFVIILNQTLLNTALPAFMDFFDITAGQAQWVTTLFMLVNGIMIPVTAFLIQKFSTRQMFVAAMGLFALGTLVAALAPQYWVLLLARVLQAAGGGMIMPLMQTILFAIFPRTQRGTAMGFFGLIIGFAPAIGPSLSGWIVDRFPWQTLFWLMLPFAVISLLIAYFLLKNVTEQTDPSLDIFSVVLSTLGFGGLLFGFSMAGTAGWVSAEVIVSLIVGVIALVWFIRRQLNLEEPMLELRVLGNPMYALNTVLGMIVFISMVGGMIVLPVYMQTMAGFSAMESGLALLPGALVMGLMSPVTGRLFDKFGGKWLAVVGFILVTLTGLAFTRLTPDTTYAYIATVNALRMLGTSMVMMPVTTAALNQLPPHLISHGTAVNNTLRQVAGSVGTAVLVTVMTMTTRDPAVHGMEGLVHGANMSFLVATVIGAFGIIGAFFIRNSHGGDTDGRSEAEVTAPK